MTRLFASIGGWAVVADLMLASLDKSRTIRNLAAQALRVWKIKAVNLFSRPNPSDLERARRIWAFANEMHESKKFFDENPVAGLDFYLSES